MYKRIEVAVGGRSMAFETGKLAKQASGSVVVSCGDTMVLVTAVAEKKAKDDMGFMPLTVEYQERLYAAGRIPGNYFRREIGRPSEKEILTSRLIDRPMRPLFPKTWRAETQVIATVFSAEPEIDPDILAMNGAAAALVLSDVPWAGPVAAARVGYVDGAYILNPGKSQLAKSRMNLVVACTETAVVMVEGRSEELSEDLVLDAIFFAHQAVQPLIAAQKELQAAAGKPKRSVTPPAVNEELKAKVEQLAAAGMEEVIATREKMARYSRYDALVDEVLAGIDLEQHKKDQVIELVDEYKKKVMRGRIVNQGVRLDGRSHDQVRPIQCEVGVLPKAHGSALFTRGETQALVVATLGSERDELHVEGLTGDVYRRFMLHYNFQPFCVGEVRALRGPSRRDIGHGTLARRGIEAVLPDPAGFPYTLRLTSEVLESNGSSSMATVCGGSLALMDAGVPIKSPVSGVAMGLIKEGDKVVVLTDILGDEDHLGDMDFKVVGTAKGIASLQMDIKIDGVDREIMGNALAQAKAGRLHILEKMQEVIGTPRTEIADHAPKYVTTKISQDKIRDIIGPGGKIIRELTLEFDAKIDVDDDGTVKIFAKSNESASALLARIEGMTAMPEVGRIYNGTVKTIKDFGAFVEILPGTDGMVHISELAPQRVAKVEDILKEGDKIKVKVLEVDSRGRIRLSRKAAMEEGNS
ncbi:polyribonucleotide nucleotidyltransferase [Candidatus Electronema sp. TJ]|uniref:polyribonucleotide nucleotidyltransferase n=1 Tax=Candidatus Electronema sp. TJ TaxID=3401573 RepID=UPI003AA9A857